MTTPPHDPSRRNALKALAASTAALALPSWAAPAAAVPGPPGFRKGANLSFWLQITTEEKLTREDLVAVFAAGFDHVRLPVNPLTIGWQGPKGRGGVFDRQDSLDGIVRMILDTGLNLILDLHPDDDTIDFLRTPAGEPAWLDIWDAWAMRWASLPPGRFILELMNEPGRVYRQDEDAWYAAQVKAIERIRKHTRDHWIMTTGFWDPINSLRKLKCPQDPRIIATTHCYWPYEITHMGQVWDDGITSGRRDVRNLRYPAKATDPKANFVGGGDPGKVNKLARDYIAKDWNIETIRPHIDYAACWSQEHRIPVHYTEFGVMRTWMDPESRWRWLSDVRSLIESYGMGWSVYDLSCNFGVISLDGTGASHWQKLCPAHAGTMSIEAGAKTALGLSPR